MKNSTETGKRNKILFIMHMPPPVHGASMMGKYIHDSKLIDQTFDCRYINLTLAKDLSDIGKGGFSKLWSFLKQMNHIASTIHMEKPQLCYVTPNTKGGAFYKDFIVVMLLKAMGQNVIAHYHNKGVATRQDFAPKQALAQARNYKLLRAKEIRNTCTYCSVGCGLLMYSLGDGAKNAREAIYHIEGDPDHPVSRGALCPKGAGLLDYVNSENRLRYPEYRAPGSDKWQRISWEEAFSRIAKLMKADRDANFIEKNEQGVTVNRWLSTGMLCASGASNETGMLTQKFARSLGMLAVDNQARV